MIYPMMINLRVEALVEASRSWKQIIIAIIVGLIYAPLLMFGLNLLFHISPILSLGLALAIVVPCSSMAIAMAAGKGLMAIPPAITPVLQIPFLIGYLKLSRKIRDWWKR